MSHESRIDRQNHRELNRAAGNEEEFLRDYDPTAYERPAITVDAALVSVLDGQLVTLVTRRNQHPFNDHWALPGGFVGIDESLEAAAARVLRSKGRLSDVFLEQLFTFGRPDRDPRARIITVVYFALVPGRRLETLKIEAAPDIAIAGLEVPQPSEEGTSEKSEWVQVRGPEGEFLPLAFDHAEILGLAVQRLRGKLAYTAIGFELLPDCFTLQHLRDIHEVILGRPLNKDSFRRRILASGDLEPTGDKEIGVGHRPAELYRVRRTTR